MTEPRPPLVRQPDKRPTLKVWFGTSGTFIGATVLLAGLQAAHDTSLIGTLPPIIGVPLGALVPTLLGFGFAYLKKERAKRGLP